MKKLAFILLNILILNICAGVYAEALKPTDIIGESAILIDRDTGQILYEKNPHKQLYPASTTKIMTGILAIEKGNLDDIVTIDQEVVDRTDGSHIALEPGERLKLRELLYALLIESANDAAVAIAIHISGSVEKFADLMNEKAKELGALNTHFVNPNGLPDENHVTTAYDLSLMAKYAMKNPIFSDIVKNHTYSIPPTNKKTEKRFFNSANRLLYSNKKINVDGEIVPIKYDGIDGVKSGYTVAAQQCLVSSATRGTNRLIAVVLKSDGRNIYVDMHKLLNYGFNNFQKVNISFKNEFVDNIKVEKSNTPYVAGIIENSIEVLVPKNAKDKIEKRINVKEYVSAPIKKGESLGKVEYFLDGEKLGQANVISTLNIEKIPERPTIINFLIIDPN